MSDSSQQTLLFRLVLKILASTLYQRPILLVLVLRLLDLSRVSMKADSLYSVSAIKISKIAPSGVFCQVRACICFLLPIS